MRFLEQFINLKTAYAYISTILLTSLLVLLHIPFKDTFADIPFILFYPAILFCALLGGKGTGLTAICLTVIGTSYLFQDHTTGWYFKICIFAGMGMIISFLVDNYRKNYLRLDKALKGISQAETRIGQLSGELQLALDAAQMGWWFYDPSTQTARYDYRYTEIFEVGGVEKPNDEILKMIHPDDIKAVWSAVEAALNPSHPMPYFAEYRIRLKNGHIKWIEAHGVATFEGEGENKKAKSLVGTVQDITERKNTERALQDLNTRLQEAIQARDDFFNITSHELKTPLTSLKLLSQLAQRAIDKSDDKVYRAESINKLVTQTDLQVNRLTRLVNDMLDVGSMKNGNLKIEPQQTEMCQIVLDVIDRMQPILTRENTPTEFICTQKIEGYWDHGRIEQVVTNLLTNAVKYGRCHPIIIKLEKRNSFARLSIKDQGIGVDPRDKDRIFNRFERAISANEVSGFGLGLFIIDQIVKAHHGRVWVESQGHDQGSTFIVELPIKEGLREMSKL